MKKISLFLIFLLLLSGVLISCSSDDGGSDSDDNETLVTHYSYNLLANETYYIVHKYESLDNGDDTYSVKKYTGHYFAKANSNYSDNGNELCAFVEFGVKQPTHKKNYIMAQDVAAKSKSSDGQVDKTYYLPKNLEYEVWYYL